MAENRTGSLQIAKAAWKDFGEDECSVRAAALAYYTVFALPPLLILLITVAGLIWDPQEVERAITSQSAGMIGQSGGEQISTIIAEADRPGAGGVIATIASIAGLLFGATGAFIQLQGALNRAWEVKPDPEQGGMKSFITKRLFSIGMVLGVGFLLAVSLALTSLITAFGTAIGGGLSGPVLQTLNFVVSFVVIAALFAAIFKVLPDARIAWRDVWIGGIATAILFNIGKWAIGFYIGRSNPGSAYGAAGSLAVLMLWAYYSAMILLFGAEFTQQWAKQRGAGIEPEEGAVRVVEKETHVRPGEPGARGGAGEEREGARPGRAAASVAAPPQKVGLGQALLGIPVFLALIGRKNGRSRAK